MELTVAGEALLDRVRSVLREVDAAVSAVQSLGGELVERMARFWEPLVRPWPPTPTSRSSAWPTRSCSRTSRPPPEVSVRAVNANGVSALVVAQEPDEPPKLLHLHGGGYIVGSAFGYRPLAGALALAADAGVLVPDYRLAPEHPFPAAIEDALCAYRWMLDRDASRSRWDLRRLLRAAVWRCRCCSRSSSAACRNPAGRPDVPLVDLALTCAPATSASGAVSTQRRRLPRRAIPPMTRWSARCGPTSRAAAAAVQAATGDDRLDDAKALTAGRASHGVDAQPRPLPGRRARLPPLLVVPARGRRRARGGNVHLVSGGAGPRARAVRGPWGLRRAGGGPTRTRDAQLVAAGAVPPGRLARAQRQLQLADVAARRETLPTAGAR